MTQDLWGFPGLILLAGSIVCAFAISRDMQKMKILIFPIMIIGAEIGFTANFIIVLASAVVFVNEAYSLSAIVDYMNKVRAYNPIPAIASIPGKMRADFETSKLPKGIRSLSFGGITARQPKPIKEDYIPWYLKGAPKEEVAQAKERMSEIIRGPRKKIKSITYE